MSILSNLLLLLLLLLSTSLVCAVASGDKGKDVAGNAGGPNMNIGRNLSNNEILKSIRQLVAKYQQKNSETTSSPIPLSENETTSQTHIPEQPSKSLLRARLESLMASPNTSQEIKSVLKPLLKGNSLLILFTCLPLSQHTITKAAGFHTEGGRG